MNKFSILIWLIVMSLSFNKGFSQCETTGTDNQTACDSYTWIDGVTYTSSNTIATHTLTNAAGCDSVVTLNLVVNLSSTAPSNVSSSDTIICNNSNINLNVVGGSLGTNSQWVWYDDFCGGNVVGNGSSINTTQTSNTTYFVRAEGSCNNTICKDITVNSLPYYIPLDSLSIDSTFDAISNTWIVEDTVCPQTAVQLFAHFSNPFPNGYSISWYENSCGSSLVGTGDSITVFPDSSTTYYARVIGTCGASLCKSITVYTKDGSIAPSAIQASANNFCTGGATTLNVVGGQLGSSATWNWYEASCGGAIIGTGTTLTVTPASTTMYYVRATGGLCGASSCEEILINTYDLNVYHSPLDTICESSPIILQGGFPQGGIYSGTGIIDSVFDPNISGLGDHTITYSFTDSNNCTNTTQIPVVVLPSNADPHTVNASLYEICNGNSSTIILDTSNQLNNGSQWFWYKGSCGTGILIDSTTTNNQITVSPSTTSNYYVRAEGGLCPASNCIGVTVDVYTLETHLNEFEKICGDDAPIFELSGGNPSGGVFSGVGVENGFFNPKTAGLGVHNITYSYTLGPCIATDVETIEVIESPIIVNYSIEEETCSEGGIMIHAHSRNGLGYYGYNWSDGSLLNPLLYAENTNYSVLVSDANNCFTLLDNIEVSNYPDCIEIPNTFSPNSDGINDYWNLDFPNSNQVRMVIYNKWGNKIIEFNENNFQWDGKTIEGNELPSGTYYYILELEPSKSTQTGPITIIR